MTGTTISEAKGRLTDVTGAPQVLVLDDEAGVAEEVAISLRNLGFATRFETSPQQALATLGADAGITVLVSDIRMPGCSGLELAHAALEGRTDADALAVVLITANANISDALQALRQGVTDFVRKPFGRDEIGKAVLRAHEQAFARRRLARKRAAMRARIAEMVNENAALSSRLAFTGVPGPEIEKTLSDALGSRMQFLSLVSHELRTPLVPILGFSELLAHGAVTDMAVVREYASLIHEAGHSQMRLIDGILLLTRLHAGELAPTPEVLDPGSIIEATIAEFPDAVSQGLIVISPGAIPGSVILADRRQAAQALAHLLANAMRYATPATPAEIALQETDRDVSIAVSDLGPGMPRHIETAVGMPFLQGEMSFNRSQEGLGLGLAIATRLIAIQGGSLTIEARPGGGTVAVLTFPRRA